MKIKRKQKIKKVLLIILGISVILVSCDIIPSFDNHEELDDLSNLSEMEKFINEQFKEKDIVSVPDELIPDDIIAEINEQIINDGGIIPESYNFQALKEKPSISRGVIVTIYERTSGSHDNNCSISGHSNCSSGCSWGKVYRYSYWDSDHYWLYQITYCRSKNNESNKNCCTRKWQRKEKGHS